MNVQLEIRVIETFFNKEKVDRYKGFVSSPKNRKKLILELPQLKDFKWQMFEEIASFDPAKIIGLASLQSCYVISEDSSVDATTVPINRIDSLTDSGYAMILVFREANQIYYEGEPPFNRYISKKL